VSDLRLPGRSFRLAVVARCFRCDGVPCGRQIFGERFADGVLAGSARGTARLDRQVVALLPDREPATARTWFAGHPTIAIIARDRGGG
jgi:hypothetical protein